MGKAETLDHRIGIGQRGQQQPNPRASHDTPANILNAAARVPGAPARLSVQSAFPSLADPAFLLLRPPWMASVGDHAAAGKVAESRGVQAAPPSMAGLSTLPPWTTQVNIYLTDAKCGCGAAQCGACYVYPPANRRSACARLEIVTAGFVAVDTSLDTLL